jgi:uncharacterized protein DUF2188
MKDYQIVRSGERWEVRAGGIVEGTFDTEREAAEAAEGLSKSAASVARVHGDESEQLSKRVHAGGPRTAQGRARRQPKDAARNTNAKIPRAPDTSR